MSSGSVQLHEPLHDRIASVFQFPENDVENAAKTPTLLKELQEFPAMACQCSTCDSHLLFFSYVRAQELS